MRWLSFAILAYLTIAIQSGLGGYISWGSAAPNLVLPVTVFILLNTYRDAALLGAFVLGAMQDLFTQQPPGLYAFSYGLIGLFLVGAQGGLSKDNPLTHFFVTLAAGLGIGAVVWFNDWSYPVLHALADAPGPSMKRVLGSALYTAILAPAIIGGLSRFKVLFGFRTSRHGSHYPELARGGRR